MNPLSALGQAVGNAAHNVQNYFWKPQQTAQATSAMPNSPMGMNIKSPVPMTPMTNQLGPGMHSPIPQQQQMQRPIQPSGFQNTMNTIGNAGHAIANFVHPQQTPQVVQQSILGAQSQRLPIRLATPTPTMNPMQQVQPKENDYAAYMTKRFGGNRNDYIKSYRTAVTSPGWSGHYFGDTPTPTPTPQPGVSQIQQFPTQIQGVDQQVAQNYLNTLQQILPTTRKYGIPDAVVAAQAAQESGYMQKPAAHNNFFGLRGHTMPWAAFDTPQGGAEYYAQTVQSKVPNMQGMSPLQVLTAMQSGKQRYEGDNPDPMQYVYDVSHNPAWTAFGGGSPYPTNPGGWAR